MLMEMPKHCASQQHAGMNSSPRTFITREMVFPCSPHTKHLNVFLPRWKESDGCLSSWKGQRHLCLYTLSPSASATCSIGMLFSLSSSRESIISIS